MSRVLPISEDSGHTQISGNNRTSFGPIAETITYSAFDTTYSTHAHDLRKQMFSSDQNIFYEAKTTQEGVYFFDRNGKLPPMFLLLSLDGNTDGVVRDVRSIYYRNPYAHVCRSYLTAEEFSKTYVGPFNQIAVAKISSYLVLGNFLNLDEAGLFDLNRFFANELTSLTVDRYEGSSRDSYVSTDSNGKTVETSLTALFDQDITQNETDLAYVPYNHVNKLDFQYLSETLEEKTIALSTETDLKKLLDNKLYLCYNPNWVVDKNTIPLGGVSDGDTVWETLTAAAIDPVNTRLYVSPSLFYGYGVIPCLTRVDEKKTIVTVVDRADQRSFFSYFNPSFRSYLRTTGICIVPVISIRGYFPFIDGDVVGHVLSRITSTSTSRVQIVMVDGYTYGFVYNGSDLFNNQISIFGLTVFEKESKQIAVQTLNPLDVTVTTRTSNRYRLITPLIGGTVNIYHTSVEEFNRRHVFAGSSLARSTLYISSLHDPLKYSGFGNKANTSDTPIENNGYAQSIEAGTGGRIFWLTRQFNVLNIGTLESQIQITNLGQGKIIDSTSFVSFVGQGKLGLFNLLNTNFVVSSGEKDIYLFEREERVTRQVFSSAINHLKSDYINQDSKIISVVTDVFSGRVIIRTDKHILVGIVFSDGTIGFTTLSTKEGIKSVFFVGRDMVVHSGNKIYSIDADGGTPFEEDHTATIQLLSPVVYVVLSTEGGILDRDSLETLQIHHGFIFGYINGKVYTGSDQKTRVALNEGAPLRFDNKAFKTVNDSVLFTFLGSNNIVRALRFGVS